jgi:hypothetical protein
MANDEHHKDEHHKIDDLQKALYSRQGIPHLRKDTILHPKNYEVSEEWKPEPEAAPSGIKIPGAFFKKLFIFSILFFLVAGAVSAYVVLRGQNVVSAKNVNITILGPISVGAGEELSLDIAIANKNSVDLELTDLVIQYPSGTRQAGNTTVDLPRDRITLGNIASGKTVQKTIKAVLFGEQGDAKEILVRVEYRLKDSNTVFYKEKKYAVTIESSPVSLAITSLKEINSGQELVLNVKITSNSASIIKGLLFKANFPFGFKYESSVPAPVSAQSVWSLGDIEPGGTREIKITGTVIGQDNDERVFRFYTGTESQTDNFTIGTVFIDTRQQVIVHKPFLGVAVYLDGDDTEPHFSEQGSDMRGELDWTNNLDTPLHNIAIDMKISGAVLRQDSISAADGFYRSSDNTIIWSSEDNPDLVELKPGQTGKVVFEVGAIDLKDPKNAGYRNPELKLSVTVRGKRFSDSNVPEEIVATLVRTVRIGSNLSLETGTSYERGAFKNEGPIPPKVNKATTYTINLKARNSLNDIKHGAVTAKLPQYVSWMNSVSPQGAVSYNSTTREITWSIGDMQAGTGYFRDPKEVSFQVSLLPSLSQVGSTPILLNNILLKGSDTFTGKELNINVESVTTLLVGEQENVLDSDKVSR